MRILFIQTGGTIDKAYPRTVKGYAFEIDEPAVKRILEKVNPAFDYEVISLLRKDSLDISAEDRNTILKHVEKSTEEKIIITHGTDTIIETAKVLSSIQGKTIVLTGAARPEKFSDSDAMFNIGLAVAGVQTLASGVYVAMNGKIYEWDKVKKDEKTGRFIESS